MDAHTYNTSGNGRSLISALKMFFNLDARTLNDEFKKLSISERQYFARELRKVGYNVPVTDTYPI